MNQVDTSCQILSGTNAFHDNIVLIIPAEEKKTIITQMIRLRLPKQVNGRRMRLSYIQTLKWLIRFELQAFMNTITFKHH